MTPMQPKIRKNSRAQSAALRLGFAVDSRLLIRRALLCTIRHSGGITKYYPITRADEAGGDKCDISYFFRQIVVFDPISLDPPPVRA